MYIIKIVIVPTPTTIYCCGMYRTSFQGMVQCWIIGGILMELKELYYLIAVAETGSMHLAAERLHVSQQNISRVLNKFEKELQIPLFKKSNFGTSLTPEGEKIYLHAVKIAKDVQALVEEVKIFPRESHSLKGSILVYYSNSINSIVDNFVFSFQRFYPNVIFSVVESTTKECLSAITNKQKAFLFLQLPMDKLMKKKDFLSQYYECFMLSSEALKLVIHKDNPLAKQSTVSLKKLSSVPFAIRTSSIDNIPEHIQTVLDMGIPLNIKYCSNSDSSITKYIKQNQACCLSTNTNIKSFSSDLITIQIRERIYIALCILIPKELDYCMQQFADYILNTSASYAQKLF